MILYFFVGATKANVEKLKKIINLYCRDLGQDVNLSKSTLVFNRNTTMILRMKYTLLLESREV